MISWLLNYLYANSLIDSNDEEELKKAYNLLFDSSVDYGSLVKLDSCTENLSSLINVQKSLIELCEKLQSDEGIASL